MSNWSFGKISRHSLILVVAGLSFVALGWSIQQYQPGGYRYQALSVAREVMSLSSWGYVFIALGLLVTIVAHWPNIGRVWGYTILTGLSLAWSMFYFLGAFSAAHLGDNLSSGIVWGLQAFVWWAISGLPDINQGMGRMPLWIGSRKKG